MLQENGILVRLVLTIDAIPMPPAPAKRGRGKPREYSEKLILKALLIMIIRRLYSAYALLSFLQQDDPVVKQLRALLRENGKFPSRRTWERRLKALPDDLPGLIGCFGRHLSNLLKPWQEGMEIVSCDSTALKTGGGVWHKKDRQEGYIPHTTIDTEAHWSKSGWHGWWYGWKLHLAVSAGHLWIPLAAELTVANTYDSTVAPQLLDQLSEQVRFVLGDKHYNDPDLHKHCEKHQRLLITPQPGAYPHQDEGVELRRCFHKLRSQSIEPFNGLFKTVFDWRARMPFKGLLLTKLFALGAVFLYQIVLLFQFQQNQKLGVGIKPLLRAA
jgi:hypothetical protein